MEAFIFLLLLFGSLAKAQNMGLAFKSNNESFEAFRRAEDLANRIIKSSMKYILPLAIKINDQVKISGNCTSSLIKIIVGVRQMKPWALKLFDAIGKPPAGILSGTISTLGSYDECVRIIVPNNRHTEKKEAFRGQYCVIEGNKTMPTKPHKRPLTKQLLELDIINNHTNLYSSMMRYSFVYHFMKIRYGICIPSTCTADDLKQLVNGVLNNYKLKFDISVARCEIRRDWSLSDVQKAIFCTIGILVFLVSIGTLWDSYHDSKESKYKIYDYLWTFFSCFSLRINGNKFLSTKTSIEGLNALHGIRFLTISWLMLGSTHAFFHPQNYKGLNYIQNTAREISFQTVLNAWVSIDTFFFMSGLLTMYITAKGIKETNGKISLSYFLVNRYLRLTPTLLIVIGLFLLLPLIGSGPVWEELVGERIEQCEKNWWATLLYINNWKPYKEMCITVSWYLSIDVQLHIFCLVILIPFFKNPKVGITIGAILSIACSCSVIAIMLLKDMYPSFILPNRNLQHLIIELYMKPYSHAGPFCIGMLTGYFILNYRDIYIKKSVQAIAWCISIACNLIVIYLPHQQSLGYVPSPFEAAQYTALTRLCWACGLSWITYTCISGRAGVLNQFLSCQLFIPLSRLTYCFYLLHEFVISLRYGLMRQTMIFSNYNMVYEFLSTMFIVTMASILCHLMVEAPFLRLKNTVLPDWNYYVPGTLKADKSKQDCHLTEIVNNTSQA